MFEKVLYTCGCSCTVGDDLKRRYIDAWPSLLSKKLNYMLINEADTGVSNKYIYRKTLNYILKNKDHKNLLVIIGWTNDNRIEFYNRTKNYPSTQSNIINMPHMIFGPTEWDFNRYVNKDMIKKVNIYLEQIETYYFHLKINLVEILKYYKIPSIFFDVYHVPVKRYGLKNMLKNSNMTNLFFKNNYNKYIIHTSFVKYCVQQNCLISEFNHPLENGHIVWSEYLYTRLNKYFL